MKLDIRQRLTKIYMPKKKGKQPLKRSLSGYETETFILDKNGALDNSDFVLKEAEKQGISVKPEWMKSCVEIVCLPHRRLSSTALDLVNNMEKIVTIANKNDRHIFPFATYFGKNVPVFREKKRYSVQELMVGEKYKLAGLFCAYHQHYTLPKGVFDHKKKMLKKSFTSRVKRTMLDSYNFLIAADPILTTFLQSSPYVNNKLLGKDYRMLLQRGGKKLDFMGGEYSNLQMYGGLPPYKQTVTDLISSLNRRYEKRQQMLEEKGFDTTKLGKETILDFSWNPVKINKIGTLEYRGGDMNFLSIVLATSTMIKFALRKIQQDFTIVIPMDLKLKDAFKVENNLLFIPPHSLVRKQLQKESAYKGLASDRLYNYAKAFYNFVNKEVFPEYKHLLKPIEKMLDTRKTMSDKIISKAKKMGCHKKLTDEVAKEMALYYSDMFKKDLQKTKEALTKTHEA